MADPDVRNRDHKVSQPRLHLTGDVLRDQLTFVGDGQKTAKRRHWALLRNFPKPARQGMRDVLAICSRRAKRNPRALREIARAPRTDVIAVQLAS